MRCGYVQRNIVIFLENQMPPEIADKIKSHLSWCNHCSDVAKRVEEVRMPVKDALAVEMEPSDRIVKGVMDRIENMPQEKPIGVERKFVAMAIAMVIVLLAVARLLKWI